MALAIAALAGAARRRRATRPACSSASSWPASTRCSPSARTRAKAEGVVVVAVDEHTMDELDERWPYRRTPPRARSSTACAAPARARSPTTSSSPSRRPTSPTTSALAEAIHRARRIPVVLATAELTDDGRRTCVFGGEEARRASSARPSATPTQVSRRRRRRPPLPARAPSGYEAFARRDRARGARRASRSTCPTAAGSTSPARPGAIAHVLVQRRRCRAASPARGAPRQGRRSSASTLADRARPARDRDVGDALMTGPELQANAIQTLHARRAAARRARLASSVAFILARRARRRARPRRAAPPRARRWVGRPPRRRARAARCCSPRVVGDDRRRVRRRRRAPGHATRSPRSRCALMLTSALLLSYERHERARQRLRDAFARFVPEQAVERAARGQRRRPRAARRRARRDRHVRRPARLHRSARRPSPRRTSSSSSTATSPR